MEKLNPHQAALERLYFINLLNQAGADRKAITFPTVASAERLSAPMLKRIIEKLSPEEIKFLNERIEAIL